MSLIDGLTRITVAPDQRYSDYTRGEADIMGAYSFKHIFSRKMLKEFMCIYPWTRCLARNVVYAASVPWHLPAEHHVFMWPLRQPPPVLLRHCYSRCHPTFSCQTHKTAANRMIKSLFWCGGDCHFKTRRNTLGSVSVCALQVGGGCQLSLIELLSDPQICLYLI